MHIFLLSENFFKIVQDGNFNGEKHWGNDISVFNIIIRRKFKVKVACKFGVVLDLCFSLMGPFKIRNITYMSCRIIYSEA